MAYAYNKEWRKRNPKKRNEERRRYYERGAKFGRSSPERFTEEEDFQILNPNRPTDTVLAERIKRSTRSIQLRRMRLKHWEKEGKPVGRPKKREGALSSVPMPADLRQEIDGLQAMIKASSRTDTVRRAVRICAVIQSKISLGCKLVFRAMDGTEEIIFVGSVIQQKLDQGSKLVLRKDDGTEETVVIV